MSLLNMLGGQPQPNLGANPNNIQNTMEQIARFRKMMQGKNPKEVLNNMISSGQINNTQLQQAEQMAKQFMSIMKK